MFSCSFQASSQEGASKVFELLQGKAFRSVGWSTMFDCLSIYDEKFKQSLQTAGAMLPEFPEGDAKALVAYLNVLQKVFVHSKSLQFCLSFFYMGLCCALSTFPTPPGLLCLILLSFVKLVTLIVMCIGNT